MKEFFTCKIPIEKAFTMAEKCFKENGRITLKDDRNNILIGEFEEFGQTFSAKVSFMYAEDNNNLIFECDKIEGDNIFLRLKIAYSSLVSSKKVANENQNRNYDGKNEIDREKTTEIFALICFAAGIA